MKINIVFLLLISILVSCEKSSQNKSRVDRLPYYNEATFTPHWLDVSDQKLDAFHRISPFKLVNQEGDTLSRKTFEGKIYVANFFFTVCPGICLKMTDNMIELQDKFLTDEDVLLLSHSVTPERDSVPVLKKYAEKKGISSKTWHLVTGKQEEIYKLGRKDYFIEENLGLMKEVDEFLHTENLVLIDRNGHIRGIYNGLSKVSIRQLIIDVKTLKTEN